MIKVLVCDDDELITRKVSQLIEKINCENELGLEVVEKNLPNFILQDTASFDIAVVDMEMPHMNGIEMLERLLPKIKVPVVIVSSKMVNVLEALSAGAVDFIRKPDMSPDAKINFIRELSKKIEIAKLEKELEEKSK